MTKTGCVLLAAGRSLRFGGNKLNEKINGESMLSHALAVHSAQGYAASVVVTGPDGTVDGNGLDAVAVNPAPERGISSSIQTGIEKLNEVCREKDIILDGVLFGVSDQPGLTPDTVNKLLQTFDADPSRIVAPVSPDGKRGNPVVFPFSLIPEFSGLEGDTGGGAIIRRHPELLMLVETDPDELFDVDTRADAEFAEKRTD